MLADESSYYSDMHAYFVAQLEQNAAQPQTVTSDSPRTNVKRSLPLYVLNVLVVLKLLGSLRDRPPSPQRQAVVCILFGHEPDHLLKTD